MYSSKENNMLYFVIKTDTPITQFQSIYSPNHIAANPKGYVKIPNVVEDIEKADLQESDHRYKIRVDILKMSENKKTSNIIKYVKYRRYSAMLQLHMWAGCVQAHAPKILS